MEGARPASQDDIGRVAELARRLHAELAAMRGGRLWVGRDARPEPLEDSYGALLGREDAALVVGLVDRVVVGFGAVAVERLRDGSVLGVITDLFVEPPARGVGVGEAVMARLVRFCEERGAVGVDASALPGNRAAKSFFEASGFAARLLVMHRPLAADTDGAE